MSGRGERDSDAAVDAAVGGGRGRRLLRRARWLLLGSVAVANTVGVAVAVACIALVLPGGPIDDVGRVVAVNAVVGVAYVALVVVPAVVVCVERWMGAGGRWLVEGRAPTEREVTAVLRTPLRAFGAAATLWLAAAVVFSVLNGILELELLARVGFTVAFGGLVTATFTYLLAERTTRPLAKVALATGGARRPRLPGVATRTMLGWVMGTGIPVVGLVVVAVFSLIDPAEATKRSLAVTMIVLGGVVLVFGGWVTALGARAVAEPIVALRRATERLGRGDLSTRVEVADGSVLGLLQAAFNDMAQGLEERERLRDLYGRQVGEDVARGSLERGTSLGGEVRDVAVVFVDVVGSTELAATRPAAEVVDLLNAFFGVVVDEVDANGGWVNKFQGDATLAVFGAPEPLPDAADRALATARALARRLPAEVPELPAGIGVAYGPVVAGNVGAERRFEFTVVGDPVNEAARLTEQAKQRCPMVVASAAVVEAAGGPERDRWSLDGTAHLRGRSAPTRLAVPVTPSVPGPADSTDPTDPTDPTTAEVDEAEA
ncbi:MAG TPA: adenylate/guanylate cyclase domain-containing protein [Acidimicrobiales bacterium]